MRRACLKSSLSRATPTSMKYRCHKSLKKRALPKNAVWIVAPTAVLVEKMAHRKKRWLVDVQRAASDFVQMTETAQPVQAHHWLLFSRCNRTQTSLPLFLQTLHFRFKRKRHSTLVACVHVPRDIGIDFATHCWARLQCFFSKTVGWSCATRKDISSAYC